MLGNWASEAQANLDRVLDRVCQEHAELCTAVEKVRLAPAVRFNEISIEPATVLWTNVMSQHQRGVTVRSIDGKAILPDPAYVRTLAEEVIDLVPSTRDCTNVMPGWNCHSASGSRSRMKQGFEQELP